MLKIPWTARRTNASIWKQLDVEPMLEYKIRSLKVSYFGHVARRHSLEHTVMLRIGGGGSKRRRPRSRWMDEIATDTGMNVYQMF